MTRSFFYLLVVCIIVNLTTGQSIKKDRAMVEKKSFGTLSNGKQVTMFTLKNTVGATAEIIDYGATVVSLTAPDRNGKYEDVVLGYDNVEGYVRGSTYFGAIVGRYGNRIGKGKFTLDGKTYQLKTNNGENHLHGGVIGYNKVLWNGEIVKSEAGAAVAFTYVSPDGEEGYPGTVTLKVTFTLTNNNELKIDYEGTTDKPTVLNPTHHGYFNLSGNPTTTIADHQLMINADATTAVDKGLIPTGEIAKVDSTPFDFRTPTAIGARINVDNVQLKFGGGYDHNWVLNNVDGKVHLVATVYEAKSGRYMELLTNQPGLQFYSGNFLNGMVAGKGGIKYQFRSALCLEAQGFPDSPNKPTFPSVTLKPGETYKQTTIYKFSTK